MSINIDPNDLIKSRTISIDSDDRVETGAVTIKYKNGYEDWPGVFIRGDNAFAYAMELHGVINNLPDSLEKLQLKSLYKVLTNSMVRPENTWKTTISDVESAGVKKLRWPSDYGAFLGSIFGVLTIVFIFFTIWMLR